MSGNQQQNQQTPDYSPTKEGLPTADDYSPELIGTAELEAGDPVQVWDEFGLELVPVVMDGEDTGRRIIRRNGKYISDVSAQYKLLPNERAVAVANDVARELGAEPFHEWSRDDGDDWYATLDDHVFQDKERRRIHALYAWDDPVDIGGGDEVQFGFAVHNSIDASLSFQVGLFSFRHACANMVTMAVKDTQKGTFNTSGFDARNVEDEREILSHSARKHTSEFEIEEEALKGRIMVTLSAVDPELDGSMDGALPNAYEQWRDEHIRPDMVDNLIRLVEAGRLPASDVPDWVNDAREALADAEDNESLTGEQDRTDVIEGAIPTGETVWDAYNDTTEAIWHSDSGDMTKQRKYKVLHKAIQPAPGVR